MADAGFRELLPQCFASWPRAPYDGARELIAQLRQSYQIGCLSNCNELHWAQFSSFLSWFDWAFSSHLLGAVKPDPEVFAAALARASASPERVWFFDDSLVNVRAAAAVGIRAVHTDGFAAVVDAVREKGLTQARDIA